MGWLLTKPKSKPAVRRNSGAAIDPKPWNPARTLANIEAILAVALLAAIIAGWSFAERRLTQYVHVRELPRIGGRQVELTNAPAWMSPGLRTEVQMSVAGVASGDPLDSASLERVVEALCKNPWVARVERVQRLPGGRLSVVADYREPIATVETPDGFHLVDIKGIHLPGLYREDQLAALGLPRIVGAHERAGEHGQPWPGEDVKAGLALIRVLRNEAYLGQITAFDVGDRYATPVDKKELVRIKLALKTRRGQVIWGSPPGKEIPLEPDTNVKKRRLNEIRSDRRSGGSIDAGGRNVWIDGAATFAKDTVSQEPLEQEPAVQVGYTWPR